MNYSTRKLVTPADLNPRGTLHGGMLLKWIDEEGGIHAAIELGTGLLVTKYISEINFIHPVLPGDVVILGMKTIDIGKTSITLGCEVKSLQSDRVVLKVDKIVYVRVDKYGQSKEHGKAWSDE